MLTQAWYFYCILTTWYVFAGGWVHGVSFSASGNKLAWVGHDSSISVVNAANECRMATIQGDFLPFTACVWVTENSIITAGKYSWLTFSYHGIIRHLVSLEVVLERNFCPGLKMKQQYCCDDAVLIWSLDVTIKDGASLFVIRFSLTWLWIWMVYFLLSSRKKLCRCDLQI